jgi:SAM-dependent methyltransferase
LSNEQQGNPPDQERPSRAAVPSGLRWRLTGRFTARSRQKRFEEFMGLMEPAETDRILDVGVTDTAWRSGNFLEANYPWPRRITAVALQPMPVFESQFPEVDFVVADGRALPFGDRAFDVGFSNAVVEHVGSRDQQAAFVGELLRTCRRVFIATPNARFPIDPHTLLPFIHWLSPRLRYPLLRLFRQGRWAREEMLNPLSAEALISLFPQDANVRLVRQRLFGLTTVLIAVARPDDKNA